ncbi:30S ribosomal protein S11 [Candidatus Azambacteria bacterium]|nr:30S ribosomal protein S11 [Candidatus Azambacteria bacterium]
MGKKRVITKTDEVKVDDKKSSASSAKSVRHILFGNVYVNATYNNTLISVTDMNGAVLVWGSSGNAGFKGAKKATPYAASRVGDMVAEKLKKSNIGNLTVYLKGVGSGRESAIRALAGKGLNIIAIKDITPVPHNGPRAPKSRRI